MAIKLSIFKWKGTKRINVSYPLGIQGKYKSKTFKISELDEALNYAMTLNESYVSSVAPMLMNHIQATNHSILQKMYFF